MVQTAGGSFLSDRRTPHSMYEIEQKYRIMSPAPFRRRLKELGAKVLPQKREYNDLYDQEGRLASRESLLRLRHYGGHEGILTFKGPRKGGEFKKRLEVETPVDAAAMRKILQCAGFKRAAGYRKRRQVYRIGRNEVTLDHLDRVGWFLEIEGTAASIRRLEKKLGLKESDREHRNYLELSRSVKLRKP